MIYENKCLKILNSSDFLLNSRVNQFYSKRYREYGFEDKIISLRNNFCSIIEDKQNTLFFKIKKEMESQK